MNILDFDDTIYDGDTGVDIVKYGLKKHFFLTIFSILSAIPYFIIYRKFCNEKVKEKMLSFIFKIKNKEEFINSFIENHIKNIKPWYYERDMNKDIIISASYEVWVKPFCKRIGIKNVIATKTDENGKIIGSNCKGEEKIRRLYEEYGKIEINEAYSDSMSDLPMLKIAKKPYMVYHDKIVSYLVKS